MIHDAFCMPVLSMPALSDKEIEFINERAISSFCMSEYIEESKDDLDKLFSAFLYMFNYTQGCYEFISRTKRITDYCPSSTTYLRRVYAVIRPKHSPSIVYRHLMGKWVRRPNSNNQDCPKIKNHK